MGLEVDGQQDEQVETIRTQCMEMRTCITKSRKGAQENGVALALPHSLVPPIPFIAAKQRIMRVSFSGDIQDPPGQDPLRPAVGDPASA